MNGQIDTHSYTWITGRCQQAPATILSGSDWVHPGYDIGVAPSCRCDRPRRFDRSTEWCTGSPSCEWYPYSAESSCGSRVRQLEVLAPEVTGPTRIFHDTQACIARGSCDDRCRMDNCNWLSSVVPDFVDPYVQKRGMWPFLIWQCRHHVNWWQPIERWLHERMCAGHMAAYHIVADLLPALTRSGCGSERDWEQVFVRIQSCTAQSLRFEVEQVFANTLVYLARSYARERCMSLRTEQGIPPFIDPALAGRECRP